MRKSKQVCSGQISCVSCQSVKLPQSLPAANPAPSKKKPSPLCRCATSLPEGETSLDCATGVRINKKSLVLHVKCERFFYAVMWIVPPEQRTDRRPAWSERRLWSSCWSCMYRSRSSRTNTAARHLEAQTESFRYNAHRHRRNRQFPNRSNRNRYID